MVSLASISLVKNKYSNMYFKFYNNTDDIMYLLINMARYSFGEHHTLAHANIMDTYLLYDCF